MAACLQDHGRAVVVGERSFGKGTVQELLPIESGRSLLKLTTASYWRPSGKNIHRMPDTTPEDAWGVRPDAGLEVPMSDEQYEAYREWRSQRDLMEQPATSGNAVPGGGAARDNAAIAAEPGFNDRQLQAAVEYLEGVLDERSGL
jgi:carboxyl-terminal processing protease